MRQRQYAVVFTAEEIDALDTWLLEKEWYHECKDGEPLYEAIAKIICSWENFAFDRMHDLMYQQDQEKIERLTRMLKRVIQERKDGVPNLDAQS